MVERFVLDLMDDCFGFDGRWLRDLDRMDDGLNGRWMRYLDRMDG
jgi:hypothetical protein